MTEQISFSEVNSFRRCPKAWEYRYKERIKRKLKGVRLLRGEILHEMLNAYIEYKIHGNSYDGPDSWDVLQSYADEYSNYFEEEAQAQPLNRADERQHSLQAAAVRVVFRQPSRLTVHASR